MINASVNVASASGAGALLYPSGHHRGKAILRRCWRSLDYHFGMCSPNHRGLNCYWTGFRQSGSGWPQLVRGPATCSSYHPATVRSLRSRSTGALTESSRDEAESNRIFLVESRCDHRNGAALRNPYPRGRPSQTRQRGKSHPDRHGPGSLPCIHLPPPAHQPHLNHAAQTDSLAPNAVPQYRISDVKPLPRLPRAT